MTQDDKIWQHYLCNIHKIKTKKFKRLATQENTCINVQQNRQARSPLTQDSILSLPQQATDLFPDLLRGVTTRIDKNIAKKVLKGRYCIDATLDLHSYTQVQAYEKLAQFITTSFNEGIRLVLVITGKGALLKSSVLKERMQTWLNTPALKENILYFNFAAAKHGKTGAFYILLKRQSPNSSRH